MIVETKLPEDLEPYVKDLEYIFQSMMYKLSMNSHKGFTNVPLVDLMTGAQEETAELSEAFEKGNPFKIFEEGVDVANMGLLVAIKSLEYTPRKLSREKNDEI